MIDCLGWTKVILQIEMKYLQMKWFNKEGGEEMEKKMRARKKIIMPNSSCT